MSLWMLLLLIFVLFFLPEVFRRPRGRYEYPDIPEPAPPVTVEEFKADGREGFSLEHSERNVDRPQVVMPPEVTVPRTLEEASSWQGRLNLEQVANGVIFSEILQPPRCKRSFALRR